MKKGILRWESGGTVCIVVLGSVLHFAFEWSGRVIQSATIALAVVGILFVLLTFYTPQLSVFRGPVSGGYDVVG